MAQVSMTVRMDSELKSAFDALCGEFGMSANTAMNVFAKAVVRERMIPFEIKADNGNYDGEKLFKALRARAERGETPDLTMDEIDEEIRLARQERREKDAREKDLHSNRH